VAELNEIFVALPHGELQTPPRLASVKVPEVVKLFQVTDPFVIIPTPLPPWLSHFHVLKLK
jgi:hypothetical protein